MSRYDFESTFGHLGVAKKGKIEKLGFDLAYLCSTFDKQLMVEVLGNDSHLVLRLDFRIPPQ